MPPIMPIIRLRMIPAFGVAAEIHDHSGEHHHAHRGGHRASRASHATHATHAAATHAAAHAAHAATHAAAHATHAAAHTAATHAAHATAAHAAHLAGGTLGDDPGGRTTRSWSMRAVGDRHRHPAVASAFGLDGDQAVAHRIEEVRFRNVLSVLRCGSCRPWSATCRLSST